MALKGFEEGQVGVFVDVPVDNSCRQFDFFFCVIDLVDRDIFSPFVLKIEEIVVNERSLNIRQQSCMEFLGIFGGGGRCG